MIPFEHVGRRFKRRAAGVCLNEGHVFLQTIESADYHFLPGGKIEMREDSATALKHEMREEIGCEVEIKRLLWIVENFFDLGEESYHEVLFIYEMTPEDEKILDPTWELDTTDTGVEIFFRWYPLEGIGKINLKPNFLRGAVKSLPKNPTHLIIRE